jgi:hypothetical protein
MSYKQLLSFLRLLGLARVFFKVGGLDVETNQDRDREHP